MSDQLTKDTMIRFRSTIVGKNSKGGDRYQLYLTTEEAASLAAELQNNAGNERGVKLDLHISERESEDGRRFKAAMAFVKAVQESSTGYGAKPTATKTFKPKAVVNKSA